MYSYNYNPVRKVWVVWFQNGAVWEVIKTFKTERAAQTFCEKHS